MVRINSIPAKDYNFMEKFFVEEPEMWDEIRGNLGKMRLWAKTIKDSGWYNVDDKATYEYFMEIGADNAMKFIREAVKYRDG